MASSRTVSTPVLALLSVAAGLFLGLLLGRHWADRAERAAREQWYAMRRQISEQYSPRRDSLQQHADSLARLESMKDLRRSPFPREVRRLQALDHCVVTFVFSAGGSELELFHATAEGMAGAPLRTGWTYREQGYPQGSTVDVVIPEIDCADIRTLSPGGSKVLVPPLRPEFIPPAPTRPRQPPEPTSAAPSPGHGHAARVHRVTG